MQLDRADFPAATAPWLVVVFSSASCTSCADVVRKAEVLRSAEVDVVDVEFGAARDLHRKYCDRRRPDRRRSPTPHGVVRSEFVGPVTATDLWAAIADVRGDLTRRYARSQRIARSSRYASEPG